MTHHWKDKICVVCGASSGLGLQLTEALLSQGAEVLMVARQAEKLEAASQQLLTLHPVARLRFLASDLCSPTEAQALRRSIEHRAPRVDLLINAIGQSDRGTVRDLETSRLLELFQTNVVSQLHVARYLTPLLRRTGADAGEFSHGGTLVMVGSLSCHFAPRYLGGYSIAKHGLAALAQQTRLELAEEGIHVMLVSPGPIARSDAGQRYADRPQAGNVPAEALGSGGGAKLRGLDGEWLSREILRGAAQRKKVLILPRVARLLAIVSAISPSLGDYILRRRTS